MKSLFIFLISFNSFALVDYSDPAETISPVRQPRSQAKVTRKAAARNNANATSSAIDLSTSFTSHSYASSDYDSRVESVNIDGHIETSNFYLDLNIPMYSGRITLDQSDTSYQRGNPLFLLGLNWLQIGNSSQALTLDIYGGMRFSTKSDFGADRSDKIVGVTTSKRLGNFALGLGYELMLTGSSENDQEQDLGNITQLKAQIGWLVSNDIRFILNANTISVSKSNDKARVHRLDSRIKYSYVQPEMVLTMGPGVHLHLKGLFQTRRAKSELISKDAKLWHLPGYFGNNLSAGLNFSI